MFHVSQIELPERLIIEPGNWGRLVRTWSFPANPPNPVAVALWELALETARVSIDPALPSRLDCIFLTETEEAAMRFRDRFRSGGSVYQVEFYGQVGIQKRCDFDLISADSQHTGRLIERMAEQANRYWLTEPSAGMVEVLYTGAVRVRHLIKAESHPI